MKTVLTPSSSGAVLACFLSTLLWLAAAIADEEAYKDFGDYRVHYSAFNSSFVSPEVASVYNISRGADRGLVNIAVVPEGAASGRTALVGGTVTDMLARQQTLEFVEVREGDAVYYLAPFRFANEDPLTFKVNVRPAGSNQTREVRFQRTFYRD